jgi:hypothetical protein
MTTEVLGAFGVRDVRKVRWPRKQLGLGIVDGDAGGALRAALIVLRTLRGGERRVAHSSLAQTTPSGNSRMKSLLFPRPNTVSGLSLRQSRLHILLNTYKYQGEQINPPLHPLRPQAALPIPTFAQARRHAGLLVPPHLYPALLPPARHRKPSCC